MCDKCNCDNYDKCSIIGYIPIGFCCSYCYSYDEKHTCLDKKTNGKKITSSEIQLKLISTSIEGELLKIVVDHQGREKELYIDLKKYLESEQ